MDISEFNALPKTAQKDLLKSHKLRSSGNKHDNGLRWAEYLTKNPLLASFSGARASQVATTRTEMTGARPEYHDDDPTPAPFSHPQGPEIAGTQTENAIMSCIMGLVLFDGQSLTNSESGGQNTPLDRLLSTIKRLTEEMGIGSNATDNFTKLASRLRLEFDGIEICGSEPVADVFGAFDIGVTIVDEEESDGGSEHVLRAEIEILLRNWAVNFPEPSREDARFPADFSAAEQKSMREFLVQRLNEKSDGAVEVSDDILKQVVDRALDDDEFPIEKGMARGTITAVLRRITSSARRARKATGVTEGEVGGPSL